MIDLKDLHKTYHTAQGTVEALKGVTLHIGQADVFGIIGHSGAGKSTLVRCINLLERPDAGEVRVNGQEMTALSEKQLCTARREIGMIFQHFNLLQSYTVIQNIAFPLEHTGKSKKSIREKSENLLELVGLADKRGAYPSQLSGGQKQRVSIARSLANDPKILLSDEATSALDPQTTLSILELLADLNAKLGLTIVLITHEMQVVKEICNKLAVLDDGAVVEHGRTAEVFASPQHATTARFVSSLFGGDRVRQLLNNPLILAMLEKQGVLAQLYFTGESANEAYISAVSRKFDIDVSVVYGNVEIVQSQPIGSLFVVFSGPSAHIWDAVDYLRRNRVRISFLHGEERLAQVGQEGAV